MTATVIPVISPVRAGTFTGQPTATSLDYVETASGAASGDTIALNGLVLACLNNTDAGGQTITYSSVADTPYNRTLDITTYAQATTIRSAVLFRPDGWRNADGTLHATASSANQKYSCFSIPGTGAPWSGTSTSQAGRTAIQPITPYGPYPGVQPAGSNWPSAAQPNALSLNYTMAAMDNANGNCIIMNGPLLLLFTDGGANTMTISSVADYLGRTTDITTYAVGSGLYSAIYLRPDGWRQTNGYLYLTASAAAVKVAAFACPG